MRRFIVIFLITVLLVPVVSFGREKSKSLPPFLNFGVEWGGGLSSFEYHRFVYSDEAIGCLMPPETGSSMNIVPIAYLYVNIGANLGRHSVIQLESGFSGIQKDRRVFPIQLRYSYLLNGFGRDGFILFSSAGAGLPDNGEDRVAWLGTIGGGWHFALSRNVGMDFLLSLRSCFDHPEIWSENLGKYVSHECIRRNDAGYAGLNLGIALSF